MSKTYKTVLTAAEQQLDNAGLQSTVARMLLMGATQMESSELFLRFEEVISEDEIVKFHQMLNRFQNGEAPQYILGYEYFFGRDFIVNPDVLIPRPETEYLVESILEFTDDYFSEEAQLSLVDVGTGSGAIGISLGCEESKYRVTLTDISEMALDVAKQNAIKFGLDVKTYCGNMLDPLIEAKESFDIFVSNPPYIPTEEEVEALVKENEPHLALFGGKDGLKFYREIFMNVKKIIKPKALLAFEIGWNQGEVLKALAQEAFPNATVMIKKDYNDLDRMLFIFCA
ncbi:MAG: peptide chain release factor N(5)-glutamine methyltransferase [Culicoidibacterales bacterium]